MKSYEPGPHRLNSDGYGHFPAFDVRTVDMGVNRDCSYKNGYSKKKGLMLNNPFNQVLLPAFGG
jgi:hypothetical protein